MLKFKKYNEKNENILQKNDTNDKNGHLGKQI